MTINLKLFLGGLILILLAMNVFGVEVNSSTLIYSFNITDCNSSMTSVGCGAETIIFNCSISNYNYIDYVQFRINGTDYTASRLNSYFWYDWSKPVTTYDTDSYITFSRVTIHDIGAGIALYFPNINVHLLCDACNYNITYHNCTVGDNRLVEYVGDGSANCTSYNDTQSCDYCTPAWSVISACGLNDTEYRQYADSNSCYGLTSLPSDSCGYTFTDCDSWINCSYLDDDLDCGFDTNPLMDVTKNRINWYCSTNSSSSTYSCVSYVKESGYVIQTNPQVKTFSNGILSAEQETREFFTAQNGLVNPYFTTDNLKANRTYVFGVECSSPTGKISTEHYVTPLYRDLDVVGSRSVWLIGNLGYVLGALVFLGLIIAGLFLVGVFR